MKKCIKCFSEKDINYFRTYKNLYIRNTCKSCDNEADKLRKNERRKQYNSNTFKCCDLCKQNKCLNDFTKLKVNYKRNICLACYPLFLRNEKNEWCKKERENNPQYRIKKSLAARLNNVMHKDVETLEYIGCDIDFLKKWFEYNFTNDMSWDNYGSYWNIDHIIPVNKFDLLNQTQKFLCWNWTNLTPIQVSLNCSKKNNIINNQIIEKQNILHKYLKEEGSTTKWFSADKCIILQYSA